jgi:hypothetical protein
MFKTFSKQAVVKENSVPEHKPSRAQVFGNDNLLNA